MFSPQKISSSKYWSILVIPALTAWGCSHSADSAGDPPVPVAQGISSEENGQLSETRGSGAPVQEPYEKDFGQIRFTVPVGWVDRPPRNDMIQGEFSLPGETGAARLTVSSAGGGLNSNLDRWKGQVVRTAEDPDPKESTFSVDGQTVTLLELWGRFADSVGDAKEPRPNWAMLGAAIPLGDRHCFVKCTGPRETLSQHRESILSFIRSAKYPR